MKITKEPNNTAVAEFSHVEDPTFLRRNALGRRIRKDDAITEIGTLYYYSNNWQGLKFIISDLLFMIYN